VLIDNKDGMVAPLKNSLASLKLELCLGELKKRKATLGSSQEPKG
jgi:hypothetical protein